MNRLLLNHSHKQQVCQVESLLFVLLIPLFCVYHQQCNLKDPDEPLMLPTTQLYIPPVHSLHSSVESAVSTEAALILFPSTVPCPVQKVAKCKRPV